MTSIVPQRPQLAAVLRPGLLQAMALQVGQVLEATVIGAAGSGATKVDIGGQMLNLVLPQPAKAGETVHLQVQSTGPQIKLVLQQPAVDTKGLVAAPVPQGNAASVLVHPPEAAQSEPAGNSGATPRVPVAAGNTPTAGPTASSQPQLPLTQATAPVPTAPATALLPTGGLPPQVSEAAAQMRPPAPALGVAPAVTPGGSPASDQVSQPVSPAALKDALSQMVHAAVPRQVPVVALTAALSTVLGKVALPEPVVRAAQQVLAGRVALDMPDFDGPALQAAVRGSGVFQEAALARGQMASPQTDMKSALLALQQALTKWLGPQAPMPAAGQAPPPVKGALPRVREQNVPRLDIEAEAAPPEVGKHLLERTEAALARTRLHQSASLPDPASKAADWSLDLPVLIGQQQTMLQFQIHQDEPGQGGAAGERGWQMRFALHLSGLGEVGAQVSLRSGATGVMLWASDPAAAAALEEDKDTLREAMAAAGLRLGALVVRTGAPVSAAPPTSGQLVDSRS